MHIKLDYKLFSGSSRRHRKTLYDVLLRYKSLALECFILNYHI